MTPAVVVHGPGDVRIEDRPPSPPGPGEVTVGVLLGGICGSDISYVRHGSVGESRLRSPMVLGHEVSGVVIDVGPDADRHVARAGDRVAVHPATVDGTCPACHRGVPNQCWNARYLGSAAHLPHTDGGLVGQLVVRGDQLVRLPPGLAMRRAALAEPLAIAIHAVRRAAVALGRADGLRDPDARTLNRPFDGCTVLVTGAGPIGSLVVATAHAAGARMVAVTDLAPRALAVANAVGAGVGVNVAGLDAVQAAAGVTDRVGEADVVLECSGSPAGLATALRAVRRGGAVVIVGLPPTRDVAAPLTLVATRELTITGAFRFDDEMAEAVDLLGAGLAVGPVITHEFQMADAGRALEVAADGSTSTKVLLATPAGWAPHRHVVIAGGSAAVTEHVVDAVSAAMGRRRLTHPDVPRRGGGPAVIGVSGLTRPATDTADLLSGALVIGLTASDAVGSRRSQTPADALIRADDTTTAIRDCLATIVALGVR